MNKRLKIVSVASEVEPFARTGGLADVAKSLPKALKRMGHDIIIVMPFYGQIIDKKKHGLTEIFHDLEVAADEKSILKVNVWKGEITKYLKSPLPIYFIENEKYFSKHTHLYGSKYENRRFYLFNLAVLKLLIAIKFQANIIQCHDWHTALVPYLLKKDFKDSETLKNVATVFTIHNLIFQFGHNWWEVEQRDDGQSSLPSFSSDEIEYINFAKRGILFSDVINTVSETYAEEILTKDFGEDLHRILQNRKEKLFGIINGIDYKDYNPSTDPGIKKHYTTSTSAGKKINKEYIQNFFHLPVEPNTPLFCFTSRVVEQKGFKLVLQVLPTLLEHGVQCIIMGDGEKDYIAQIKKMEKKYRRKLVYIPFSENKEKETLLYAASDIFLLPSRFEPCGINPLIAMRYGCIALVRSIGGLTDTIDNFNPKTNSGNGFLFKKYDPYHFLAACIRAVETYKHKQEWEELVKRAMKQSFSWEIPAKKYLKLFRKAIALKKDSK